SQMSICRTIGSTPFIQIALATTSSQSYRKSSNQSLQLSPQKYKRRRDKQMILHPRRVVVGVNDDVGYEWLALYVGRKKGIGNLAGRGQNAGPEDLRVSAFFDEAEFDGKPTESLQCQDLIATLGLGDGLSDQYEQLGIIAIQKRRHVAQTVVNHVRLGRELRVRPVADELRHREAALGDVLVERSVGQGTLGGHEVQICHRPEA